MQRAPALSFYYFAALDASSTNNAAFRAAVFGNADTLKVGKKTAFRDTSNMKADTALLLL